MSIRLPLKNVGTFTAAASEVGAGSTAGGFAHLVTLPQDTDNVVVKLTASVVAAAGGYSATLQTTDDGGTTWYDVSRTSVVTNANTTTAVWSLGTVQGGGMATAQNGFPTASILTVGIRSTAASTLAANQISGLPILSQQARAFVRITGDITDAAANTYTVQVLVNSQSATA
jgi:hypothetical protein